MNVVRIMIALFCVLLTSLSLADTNQQPFPLFVKQLKQRLHNDGFTNPFLARAFKNVYYIHRTIYKDKHQPEVKLNLQGYLKHMMVPGRIIYGHRYMKKNQALLLKVQKRYQVSAKYIVALLGLESSYGRVTGKYPEVSTLVTLIYNGHRARYFYKELTYALKIVQRGDASFGDLKGSWAGAMGQPQFMPTHYFDYAVDFSGNGKKDIWTNRADVLASIAYSLHRYGWQYMQPVVIEVKLPARFDKSKLKFKNIHSISYWLKQGVKPLASVKKLMDDQVSVLAIGEKNFMIFKNFHILYHWNRSKYYVMAVVKLADLINLPGTQYKVWLNQQHGR